MVKILLEAGADPDIQAHISLNTPLIEAAWNNRLEILKLLLKKGAKVNTGNSSNITAIFGAAINGHFEVVKELLKYKPDIFIQTNWGANAYDAAKSKGFDAIAKILKQSVDPKLFKGWIEIFPLAGLPQFDFLAANFVDFNPKTTGFPREIDKEKYEQVVTDLSASKRDGELEIWKKIYTYDKKKGAYFLKDTAAAEDKAKLFAVLIGYLGGYAEYNPSDPDVITDFNGGNHTYDGHTGFDIFVDDYERLEIGVPVIAVADGVVTAVVVQEVSRSGITIDDSYIIIDHGYSRSTSYIHLEKTILVKPGDTVRSGQHIGWVRAHTEQFNGHLHFGVLEWGETVEPHRGRMNKIASRWKNQIDYFALEPMVTKYALMNKNMFGSRLTHYKIGEKDIGLWINISNVDTYKEVQWKIYDPGNSLVKTFDNTNYFFADWYINNPGIWTIKIYYKNRLLKEIPLKAIDQNDPVPGNAPPGKIKKARIKTVKSAEYMVYTCEIDYPVQAFDPDLDKVYYKYEWFINGKSVRNILSASLADYLVGDYNKSDTISCKVTLYDGELYSEPVEITK